MSQNFLRTASGTRHTDRLAKMPPERGPNCSAHGPHVRIDVRITVAPLEMRRAQRP